VYSRFRDFSVENLMTSQNPEKWRKLKNLMAYLIDFMNCFLSLFDPHTEQLV
jgi:hypothetical protein